MGSIWRAIFVLSILCTKTLQFSKLKKPSSVNGCYQSSNHDTFFWSISGDNLYINITAKVTEDEWIALGLSDDTRMGNDDVVAVYKNMSTQLFSAASLLDPQHYSSTVFQKVDSILSSSASYKEGVVTANITKSIALSYPFKTLNSTPIYLFFGRGKIRHNKPGYPLHEHRHNPFCSDKPVSLFKDKRYCITETHKLLKLHGILMVVAWLYLTPLAVYIARYGKDFFERPSFWFLMHKWGSILSGVVVIVSVVLAFVALQTFEFELHQIIGIVVLLLLLFHVVLAFFRPAPDTSYRRAWEIIHRITAFLLFLGSLTNIVDGLYMLDAHSASYVVISLQLLVFGIISITLENPELVVNCTSRACVCLKSCPTLYYVLNLGGTSKPSLIKLGLWNIVFINTAAGVVIVVAIVYTE